MILRMDELAKPAKYHTSPLKVALRSNATVDFVSMEGMEPAGKNFYGVSLR